MDSKEFRNRMKVTQKRAGELLNVGTGTVKSWESGKRNPSGSAQRLMDIIIKIMCEVRHD